MLCHCTTSTLPIYILLIIAPVMPWRPAPDPLQVDRQARARPPKVDRQGQPYYIRPHHPAPRTMRRIAPCIVGLTLAVDLERGQAATSLTLVRMGHPSNNPSSSCLGSRIISSGTAFWGSMPSKSTRP